MNTHTGPGVRYRIQNGCWNCRHCVRIFYYEEADQSFCQLNSPPRPPSGSSAMPGEALYDPEKNTLDEMADAEDAWEKWSIPRKVSIAGICEKWEKKQGRTEVWES